MQKELQMQNNPYSSLKIFHHADMLDSIAKGNAVAPLYVRLKPTNLCNHHCAYCTYGSGNTSNKTDNRDTIDHRSMIPWPKMQEIIADMADMGAKAVTLSGGGEPLVYPHILDTLRLLRKAGIELSLISNGELLDGERAELLHDAKWVRISFDSPVLEEYCGLRGLKPNDFIRVTKNIEDFARNKNKDCVLGINYVISKSNCSHVYDAAKFLKKLGADNVKFAAVIENEEGYHLPIKDDVIDQIRRAKTDLEDSKFRIFNNYENDWQDKQFSAQSFSTCYTCRLVTVIAADSRIYFCHTRAYDSAAVVGDITGQSFKELWFSRETQEKLKSLNPAKECRNFCVYEERNMLIQSYFDVDMRHVNFI